MKKKVGLGILILLIVGMGVIGMHCWKLSTTPDDGSAEREAIEYLNNEVDLSLVLYGEDIDFPQELEYSQINSLESENWQRDNDYVYLIINDLNNSVTLDKETYLQLIKYADENTNFNFYYIGTDDLDMISANTKDSNLADEDMSFGYVINEGNRVIHLGLWTNNDNQYLEMSPELLSECVYSGVLANVKSNE